MQYLIYTDTDTLLLIREGGRDGDFITDVELSLNGFATGDEDINWTNIDKLTPQ
jgi:hypothetical protein